MISSCVLANLLRLRQHPRKGCSRQQNHYLGEEEEEADADLRDIWTKPMGSDYFGAAGDAMIKEMKAENMEDYLRWVWVDVGDSGVVER